MKYCSDCGHKLKEVKQNMIWLCTHCRRHFYANSVPSVDAALFDEKGRVLLGVRKREPDKGKLNLPGGYVDAGETFEEAIRELKEELGLNPSDYNRLVYAGSRRNRPVFENKKCELLSVVFAGFIKHRDFPLNEEVKRHL